MADAKKSSLTNKTGCHLLNIKHPDRVAKRLKLAFQRTNATILLSCKERTVDAGLSFVDVSDIGASVYTSQLLAKGSAVELAVAEPGPLKLRCLVAWSVPVSSGVQNRRFSFRSGLQFIFDSEDQKASFREFLHKLSADPMESLKNAANAAPAAPAPATPAAEPAPVEAAVQTGAEVAAETAPEMAADAVAEVATEAVAAAPAEASAEPQAEATVTPISEAAAEPQAETPAQDPAADASGEPQAA